MFKFEIINNSLIVTDTVTGKSFVDLPKQNVYFSVNTLETNAYIEIVHIISSYRGDNRVFSCKLIESVNSSLTPFTLESFIDFARLNLGFSSASGGSDAVLKIKYTANNYNELITLETTDLISGDLAYLENSQGTAWLPFSLGGTYYPKGWYVWNGVNWVSDRIAIAEELEKLKTLKADLVNGLIPSNQLPSYVDDVVEVATKIDLPITGESGKIYVVIADESESSLTTSYRWTGSVYSLITSGLDAIDIKNLYESNTDTNAFTDAEKSKLANQSGTNTGDETTVSIQTKRPLKTIENQSLEGSGNIDLGKADVGLANVDNTSDLLKPISTATQTALNTKVNKITSVDNQVARFDGVTGELQSSAVTIIDSGFVGIGTTTPNAYLDIRSQSAILDGSALGSTTFIINASVAGNASINLKNGTLNTYAIQSTGTGDGERFRIYNFNNGTDALVILPNSFVGIGTSDPKSKLHVTGLPNYADNATAIANGLTAGAFYIRTGHGLDVVV